VELNVIEVLGALGLLAFAVSSVAIGLRLLIVGRRSKGVPEIAIGLGFVIGAVVGYVPETIVLSTDLLSAGTEASILAVTQIAIRGAAVAVLVFTVAVFRPAEIWARGLGALILVALVASWVAFPNTRVNAQGAADRFWYDVFAVFRSLAIGWGAAESLLFYRRAKLQVRLGLMSPVLANRFLLWAIGLGALTALMGTTIWASLLGIDPAVPAWVLLESLLGSIGAVTLWLTFFPSAAYRHYLERKWSRGPDDAGVPNLG
jgi:hypothetical protein